MPYSFLDRLPELAGGKEALVQTTRDMLEITHRVSQASDLTGIPVDSVRKHVVMTLLTAIQDAVRPNLHMELDEQFSEVIQTRELETGEPDGDEDAMWWAETGEAIALHLAAAVSGLLPQDDVERLGAENGSEALTDDLLNALVKKPVDLLSAFQFTPEEIEELVAHARGAPVPPAAEPEEPATAPILVEGELTMGGFVAIVRRLVVDGEDLMELDELVRAAFSADSSENLKVAAAALTSDTAEQAAIYLFVNSRDPDPAADERDADHIIAAAASEPEPELKATKATRTRTANEAILEAEAKARAAGAEKTKPPAASRAGRPRGGNEPSAATEAAKDVLVALSNLSGVTEKDLASAIGVSRPQMINYREGKTVWTPTDTQVEVIRALLSRFIDGLEAAKMGLDANF